MKLEKRIEMLEQEVQILKSQIQATLLDIQEQLLTNTYPALRGGDIAPTGSGIQAEPNRIVTITSEGSTSRATGEGTPLIKQVSLDDFTEVSNSSLALKSNLVPFPSPQVVPSPAVAPTQETNWSELAGLESWVLKKISEIGAVRTRDLVHLYWQNGHLTLEQRDTLTGLIGLYDVNVPEPRRAKTKQEAPKPQAKPAPPAQTHKPTQSAARKTQHVPAVPAQNGSKPKPNNQPPVRKTSTTTVAQINDPDSREDSKQNTVLRLIAGINNASAGVIWGKKK